MSVEIRSRRLTKLICDFLKVPVQNIDLEFDELLQISPRLRSYLANAETFRLLPSQKIAELWLLLCDFLSDRAAFQDLDLERLLRQGRLSKCHYENLGKFQILLDLDALEEHFFSNESEPAIASEGLSRFRHDAHFASAVFDLVDAGDWHQIQTIFSKHPREISAAVLKESMLRDHPGHFLELLFCGADYEWLSDSKWMKWGTGHDYFDLLDAFIEYKATFGDNVSPNEEVTKHPLIRAANFNQLDDIKYILRVTQDLESEALNKAFEIAFESRNDQIIQCLLSHGSIFSVTFTKLFLVRAAARGHRSMAKLLVKLRRSHLTPSIISMAVHAARCGDHILVPKALPGHHGEEDFVDFSLEDIQKL